MIEIFYISSIITTIMLVWFKSDAIVEYGSLFRLDKFFRVKEFRDERIRVAPSPLTYPQFWYFRNWCFLTRLLSCPICLGIWLSIIITSITTNLLLTPMVLVVSLLMYGSITKLLNL